MNASPASRSRWQAPAGLALAALFLLSGHQAWLIGTSFSPLDLGHALFVLHVAAGLWVSYSGLRHGDVATRLLCLPVLGFFVAVVALLYLRGHP